MKSGSIQASAPFTAFSFCPRHTGPLPAPQASQAQAHLRAFAQALGPGMLTGNAMLMPFSPSCFCSNPTFPRGSTPTTEFNAAPHAPPSTPDILCPIFHGIHHLLEYCIIYSLITFTVDSVSLLLNASPVNSTAVSQCVPGPGQARRPRICRVNGLMGQRQAKIEVVPWDTTPLCHHRDWNQ